MPIVTCPSCGARNRIDERALSRQPVCGRCRVDLPAATGSAAPLEVTDATFEATLRSAASRPVLVDCWAPWCGPCRALAPVLDALAAAAEGRYLVAKLNIDDNPRTASRFGVQSIPTLLLFKNGAEVDRIVGVQPRRVIEAKLAAHA